MRILSVAAIVFAGLVAGPALAQVPYSAAYQSCQKKATTTADMVGCIVAEHKIWDETLNRNYQASIKPLSGDQHNAFRDVQRKWIAYREAKCKYIAAYHGGTIAQIEANQCMLDTTASRAFELDPKRQN